MPLPSIRYEHKSCQQKPAGAARGVFVKLSTRRAIPLTPPKREPPSTTGTTILLGQRGTRSVALLSTADPSTFVNPISARSTGRCNEVHRGPGEGAPSEETSQPTWPPSARKQSRGTSSLSSKGKQCRQVPPSAARMGDHQSYRRQSEPPN